MCGNVCLPLLLHECLALHKVTTLEPPAYAIERDTSAPLDELTRQVKVIRVLRHAIQTDQCQLDLFVSAGLVIGCIKKITHQQVGGFDANIQQGASSGRFKVRNACFDQMPQTIQLMLDLQVDPALAWEMDLVVGE